MEQIHREITVSDIERYRVKHGQKATLKLMRILGKKQKLYAALQDEKVQVIVSYIMNRMDYLLDKIVTMEHSEAERHKYLAFSEILNDIAKELTGFEKHGDKLKGK